MMLPLLIVVVALAVVTIVEFHAVGLILRLIPVQAMVDVVAADWCIAQVSMASKLDGYHAECWLNCHFETHM